MAREIQILEGTIAIDPSELVRRSRAADEDVVVLSGTLLEGFGNLYSDLDLYVISDQLPTKTPDSAGNQVVREDGGVRRFNEPLTEAGGIVLDVQYYTHRELSTLARSLNALYIESRQSTRIFRRRLHHEDEDLIHKLLTGMVVRGGTGNFEARGTFDPGMFCFLKFRNEVCGYPEFRDLVGSWMDGDLDTCLYNTRDYLIAQVSGMMFLAGSTNPRPKWFVKRLLSLDPRYAELRDEIMLWMSNAKRTEAQKREAVEAAGDLIDRTFTHARRLLEANPRYFRADEALALTDKEFSERAMHDRDTLAELQLRRRMFGGAEPTVRTQLCGRSAKLPVAGVAYAVSQ